MRRITSRKIKRIFFVSFTSLKNCKIWWHRPGGIPARNHKGERLLLYLGIIDILQSYRMRKKLEHTLKAIILDGVTYSWTCMGHKSLSVLSFIPHFYLLRIQYQSTVQDFMLTDSWILWRKKFSKRFHHVSQITLWNFIIIYFYSYSIRNFNRFYQASSHLNLFSHYLFVFLSIKSLLII